MRIVCLIMMLIMVQFGAANAVDAQNEKKEGEKKESGDSWWSFFSKDNQDKTATKSKDDADADSDEDDSETTVEAVGTSENDANDYDDADAEEMEKKKRKLREKKQVLNGKIAGCKSEREAIKDKMHALRIKMIEKDPKLKKIHQKILELYRELATKVDRKPAMRELIDTDERVYIQQMNLNKELDKVNNEYKRLQSK